MGEEISREENQRVKGIIRLLMKDTQTMNECKTISAIIGENNFMGYDLQDVEEELYYKKERWIESLKYSQN